MSTVDITPNTRSLAAQEFSVPWAKKENTYRVRVAICPDADDGGFYSYGISIPGIAGQGETEEEALGNIRDAAREAIAAYIVEGMQVPYVTNQESLPRGCVERWITVNA